MGVSFHPDEKCLLGDSDAAADPADREILAVGENELMSEEEYQKALNSSFDFISAKNIFDGHSSSYDEVCRNLIN